MKTDLAQHTDKPNEAYVTTCQKVPNLSHLQMDFSYYVM